MTLPLLDFGHSNYLESTNQNAISFHISNSGMGAAVVKNTKLIYQEAAYGSHTSLLKACCGVEYQAYEPKLVAFQMGEKKIEEGGYISTPINNIVIPPQSEHTFFQLFKAPMSDDLWTKLNNERWKVSVEMCFCTLLGDCFQSKANNWVEPVSSCEI